MIYGSGHYNTFDGKFYDFDGSCEYVATQVMLIRRAERDLIALKIYFPLCFCHSLLPVIVVPKGFTHSARINCVFSVQAICVNVAFLFFQI